MRGAQQGQQAVLGDEVKGLRLLQAQQDGQRQVEAPLQLVQVRGRLQQRPAVSSWAPGPANALPFQDPDRVAMSPTRTDVRRLNQQADLVVLRLPLSLIPGQ